MNTTQDTGASPQCEMAPEKAPPETQFECDGQPPTDRSNKGWVDGDYEVRSHRCITPESVEPAPNMYRVKVT